jgi:transposase InsO family protein/transposase-like protein
MNIHKNARLTPRSRAALALRLAQGETLKAVAAAFSVSPNTARKWANRFKQGGVAALIDRSSRPQHLHRPTPEPVTLEVFSLRRHRLTGREVARRTGLSTATVSRLLRKAGLSRWRDLLPPPPVVRYERATPGEILHIDIKRLGRIEGIGHRITGDRQVRYRGAGWEYVHVAIDDHSRVAHAQVLPDEAHGSAVAFLRASVAHYARLGVRIQRIMTDNGGCYRANAFKKACAALGLHHLFTKPYTPKTNGKAERFIQSSLREWAYAHIYDHSSMRTAMLDRWLHRYNWHRPHSSLGNKPPVSRLPLSKNNLLMLHT